MSVTATSIFAVPRQKLRAQLAEMASVQAFLEVASELDPIASAMAEAKMPDDIALDPLLSSKRPFILVGKNKALNMQRVDENNFWPNGRKIFVTLYMDVKNTDDLTKLSIENGQLVGSARDWITTMENHIGNIMAELADSSGRGNDGTNLVFGNIEMTQEPAFSSPDNWANECYMIAAFSVDLDPMNGGG